MEIKQQISVRVEVKNGDDVQLLDSGTFYSPKTCVRLFGEGAYCVTTMRVITDLGVEIRDVYADGTYKVL